MKNAKHRLKNKKNEIFLLHTKNHPRFSEFAVVVVAVKIDEILNDFHVYRNVCFPEEQNQQPILGSQRFSEKK